MAYVMAPEVPESSTMSVPYGPMGVGLARRRMRAELEASGADDTVVDDAVLILSELLSNSSRHASPLPPDDSVRADWAQTTDGRLTISVTDGGGPTRPLPATPSVTAHGGRGLSIITSLARDWGVEDRGDEGGVTVWAVVAPQHSISPKARLSGVGIPGMRGLAGARTHRAQQSTKARPSRRSGPASTGTGHTHPAGSTGRSGSADGAGSRAPLTGQRPGVGARPGVGPRPGPRPGAQPESFRTHQSFEEAEALGSLDDLEGFEGLSTLDDLDGTSGKRA